MTHAMDDFLSEIIQQGRVADAQRRADVAAAKSDDALVTLDALQRHIEVLALANQALFEILKARIGVTEKEVTARMAEIDARDGAKDGKMGARVVSCPSCQRPVSTARMRCLYCGATITEGHLFQKS